MPAPSGPILDKLNFCRLVDIDTASLSRVSMKCWFTSIIFNLGKIKARFLEVLKLILSKYFSLFLSLSSCGFFRQIIKGGKPCTSITWVLKLGKEPVGKSQVFLYSIHTIKVCALFGTPCYVYMYNYANDICTRQEFVYLSFSKYYILKNTALIPLLNKGSSIIFARSDFITFMNGQGIGETLT